MARPQAIYASIPADSILKPWWEDGPDFSIPVILWRPFACWPNLNWWGDFIGANSPINYSLEVPEYLWSDPVVQQPEIGEIHTFRRKWQVSGNDFTVSTLPEGDYLAIITHAADDQYEVDLEVQGTRQYSIDGNFFLPVEASWRNVKTFVYHLNLAPHEEVALTSIVTNNPQPNSTSESNPAMFTWIMQVFDFRLL